MKRFFGRLEGRELVARPAPLRVGNLQVLWHGCIANRSELLAEAVRRGETPSPPGDGELLALAYLWWHDQLQSRVFGQFAAAIFDASQNVLLLTHDALGLACLYYSVAPQALHFGSHLDEFDLPGSLDTLDEEYLAGYLTNCTFVGESTPFRNVRRLGVGQSLMAANGQVKVSRTWSLSSVKPLQLSSRGEYADRFRTLFEAAVCSAATADGPVWSELSGGLDSSSVTAVAAAQCVPQLGAFSIRFPGHPAADESEWIREVICRYDIPWHTIDGDAALPYSLLPDRFIAEPRYSMINWGWWTERDRLLQSNHVKVLLTGQGGDLVCLGPGTAPYQLAQLSRWWRPRQALSDVRRWQRSSRPQRSLSFWMLQNVFRPMWRHFLRKPVSQPVRASLSTWFDPRFIRRSNLMERLNRFPLPRCRSVSQQWFWERIASLAAQIAAENQLPREYELRHPFMDRALVEFVSAIPWEEQCDPSIDRFLQRKALTGILPDRICRRRSKVTFDEPTFEGLRQSRAWAEALTSQPRIVDLGIVDGPAWTQAVAQARAGRVQNLPQFVAAATLEIWLQQLRSRDPRRPEDDSCPGGE